MREKYAPGHCEYHGGYHEVRWDLWGCNLHCQFCWSPASIPEESHDPVRRMTTSELLSGTRSAIRQAASTFIRFTGGEPTLQWTSLVEALREIQGSMPSPAPPILIQTNGIAIGDGTAGLDVFRSASKQRYLIELSLKGTNQKEFALLTERAPELYAHQLKALATLRTLASQHPHIQVVAVLGVYHSATHGRSKYAFVNPTDGHLLFEDLSLWDPEFRRLWTSGSHKWVEPLRMSPKGLWDKFYLRCGPAGTRIIQYFPAGAETNCQGLFPAKPKSAEYARRLVTGWFW